MNEAMTMALLRGVGRRSSANIGDGAQPLRLAIVRVRIASESRSRIATPSWLAIINPASGPGIAADLDYDAGIDMLQAAGVTVTCCTTTRSGTPPPTTTCRSPSASPGTVLPEELLGIFDTVLVYEGAGLPDPLGVAGHDRSEFGIIPHGVDTLDRTFVSAALEHVRFVYLTDDTLPNPWDSLPTHFDELVAALAEA